MPRYVFHEGRLVEVPRDRPREPSPSHLSCPAIQSDLPPYRSPMGTGWVDGKTARREDLAKAGCRAVEPSELPAKPSPPPWLKDYHAGRGIVRSAPPE